MRSLRDVLPGFLIGLCILACGLVGNGLYGTVAQSGTLIGLRLVRLSFLCLLLLVGWALYKLRARQYGVHWTLWCAVFLAGILAGAGADSWQAWLESFAGQGGTPRISGPLLYSLLFFAVLAWVEKAFRKIPPRALVDVRSAPPDLRAHLVLFLSEIDLKAYPAGLPDWLTGNERELKADLKTLADEKRNAKRAGRRVPLWSWEQPLRAIYHHLNGKILKSATVIASRESILQAAQFAALLKKYPELKAVDFRLFVNTSKQGSQFADLTGAVSCDGFNFEDFTQLSQALHNLLFLLTKHTLIESDIMIDFTGGKKVTSVVAAAMTFNRAVKAQYVQTEEPWDVLSYSVITAQRPI